MRNNRYERIIMVNLWAIEKAFKELFSNSDISE
jgi:hypothetical protein